MPTDKHHSIDISDDMGSAQMKLARMEQLMSGQLSGSELDLVEHGPGQPTAPGNRWPPSNANVNCAFLISEQSVNPKSTGNGSV